MKATETKVFAFIEGKKQFNVPIYQRTYSWTLRQCEQLWRDIVRAGSSREIDGHFIGSIVYIQDGLYDAGGIQQLLVIDGQQRLTTLTLLLIALARTAKCNPSGGISHEEIEDQYLTNRYGRDDLHYKLLLTQADRETLIDLVEGRDHTKPVPQRIRENFEFFEQRLAGGGLAAVYRGVAKLIVVGISLDREHDNPQLIFESLNSTGLDLSQADLIRNYVLMGLELHEQADLYKNYWYPMEQRFSQSPEPTIFDRFMRDYLTLKSKSSTIPNIGEVYVSFKAYHASQRKMPIRDIVADVYRYSVYFTELAFAQNPDAEISQILADINSLKVDVAYPFLLELFDDYANARLSRDDVVTILRLVESYVIRRAICDIPTNSLNKTFATLAREIDKGDYLNSVQGAFLLKDSYRRFPRDEEFREAFVLKNVYDLTKRRMYILGKLENYGRKERVRVDDYTVEHIMPQNGNLSPEWLADLGPDWQRVHSAYLHTIGNLTLTGYNPELSDRPFVSKRDMEGGFKDSPIRLNHRLAQLDHWNEAEIVKRARALADLAIKIWPSPVLPEGVTVRYVTDPFSGQRRVELVNLSKSLQRRFGGGQIMKLGRPTGFQ